MKNSKKSTGIILPEKKSIKKMQSLIAVACKRIRVFHVILTKGKSVMMHQR